jgi:hypothetical protein
MDEANMDVFLSFAQADADVAQRVAEALRARGVSVGMDTAPLASTDDRQRTDTALEQAKAVVALVGNTSDPSVRHQRATALRLADSDPHKRLISVEVGGANAPGALSRFQHLLVDPDRLDPEALADALLAAFESPDEGRRDLTAVERAAVQRRLDAIVERVGQAGEGE